MRPESPTTFERRDPDGCAGAIAALLIEAAIIGILVLAWIWFR